MDNFNGLRKRIAEAESRFFKLFSSMQNPAAILTLPEWKFINVNYRFLQLFGYSIKELSNQALDQVGLWNNTTQYDEARKRILAEGYLREFVCSFKTQDGQVFAGRLFADYILIEECKFLLLQVVDVSAEYRMVGFLDKTQQQLASLLEQMNDGYIRLDCKNTIVYANKEAERLIGLSREELIGKNIAAECPIDYNLSLYKAAVKAMTGNVVTCSEEFLPRFGKWVEAHFYPAWDGMSIFFSDITMRKQKEAMLKQSRQEFKTLVENLTDAIVRYDRKYHYLYVNPAFVRLTGLTESQIIGKTWDEIDVPKEYSDSWRTLYNQVFFTGRETIFETMIPSPAGIRYCHVHAAPEFDSAGNVEYVLAIIRDITDRKHMEKEMARLDRLNLVGEMAASIGHEVRNPMTTVRGFLQMLSLKRDLGKYSGFFSLMIEELDRANSIITEYLSLAKNKAIDTKPANLNKILHTVLPLIQADALRRGKNIVCDFHPVLDLMLDEKEIRQCILNLVRNGLEAMEKGGAVTISTWVDIDSVMLAVKDEGTGIPAEILDKLGTPFLTTKETGTGLGLPVCYSIAKRHNASIKVDTGPGGTTFFMRFKSIGVEQSRSG